MPSMAKDKKRDAILNAAFNQFSHYSFRKTSMEDIAKAAGISRASIYSYFQNKDDIFRSVSIQARPCRTDGPSQFSQQRCEHR